MTTILAAVDRTPTARAVLETARLLARTFNAHAEALHVLAPGEEIPAPLGAGQDLEGDVADGGREYSRGNRQRSASSPCSLPGVRSSCSTNRPPGSTRSWNAGRGCSHRVSRGTSALPRWRGRRSQASGGTTSGKPRHRRRHAAADTDRRPGGDHLRRPRRRHRRGPCRGRGTRRAERPAAPLRRVELEALAQLVSERTVVGLVEVAEEVQHLAAP